jgi:Tn7-like transposition protein D/TniQ
MIHCFPSPLPGELLYSVCARYSDRMQYSDKQFLNQELFGDKNVTTVLDLPTHLNHLISVLPPGYGYTAERLIDEHTLLPFYAPFLPLQRVQIIREQMVFFDALSIHNRSGIAPTIVRRPNWLRFCPLCVQEDDLKFGEPYWHRLHQLSGVEVCPIHHVFLELSKAPARNHSNCSEYFSAQQAIVLTIPRPLDLSDSNQQVLLAIAHDATILLSQSGIVSDFESLHNRYIRLLANSGLATYNGAVHIGQLVREFKQYYSPELLSLLQCQVDENKRSNWLSHIVKSLNRNRVNHPLRHLLLIQFLGYTVEEWNKLPKHLDFFGSGPWPCLNYTCEFFRQLSIQECHLNYRTTHGGRLTGTFSCSCGFTYIRTGPDVSLEDTFRIDDVEKYGTVWEEALRQLWLNSTLSLQNICIRLGTKSNDTIKRQAVRLNLPFPRIGPRGKVTQIGQRSYRFKSARELFSDNLDSYRTEWLKILEKYPSATRTFLCRNFPHFYNRLRAYDVEWLEMHLPLLDKTRKPRQSPTRCVDWSSRDAQLAVAVRLSAYNLKNKLGHPIRVTRGSIGRAIDRKALLDTYLNKLPLTKEVLAQVVESHEEFAIRRIKWAAECFHQENIHPTRTQLVCRVSMQSKIAANPQVQAAVEQALASFESTSNVTV